jgi:hypothetical protein
MVLLEQLQLVVDQMAVLTEELEQELLLMPYSCLWTGSA